MSKMSKTTENCVDSSNTNNFRTKLIVSTWTFPFPNIFERKNKRMNETNENLFENLFAKNFQFFCFLSIYFCTWLYKCFDACYLQDDIVRLELHTVAFHIKGCNDVFFYEKPKKFKVKLIFCEFLFQKFPKKNSKNLETYFVRNPLRTLFTLRCGSWRAVKRLSTTSWSWK